jgi:hypothetical protein
LGDWRGGLGRTRDGGNGSARRNGGDGHQGKLWRGPRHAHQHGSPADEVLSSGILAYPRFGRTRLWTRLSRPLMLVRGRRRAAGRRCLAQSNAGSKRGASWPASCEIHRSE